MYDPLSPVRPQAQPVLVYGVIRGEWGGYGRIRASAPRGGGVSSGVRAGGNRISAHLVRFARIQTRGDLLTRKYVCQKINRQT